MFIQSISFKWRFRKLCFFFLTFLHQHASENRRATQIYMIMLFLGSVIIPSGSLSIALLASSPRIKVLKLYLCSTQTLLVLYKHSCGWQIQNPLHKCVLQRENNDPTLSGTEMVSETVHMTWCNSYDLVHMGCQCEYNHFSKLSWAGMYIKQISLSTHYQCGNQTCNTVIYYYLTKLL